MTAYLYNWGSNATSKQGYTGTLCVAPISSANETAWWIAPLDYPSAICSDNYIRAEQFRRSIFLSQQIVGHSGQRSYNSGQEVPRIATILFELGVIRVAGPESIYKKGI